MITLNIEQKKAASFTHGTAAVVAVPGAGKTLTMTHRIANLVKNHGVAPESILGLTFTRNAASAMKEKLRPILKDIAPRVTLATIHAFCNSLLHNEGRAFEILSEKEQLTLIKKIMKKHKMGQMPAGMVVKEIALAKNNLVLAEEFKDLHQCDATMAKIGKVYESYEKEKQKRLQLDLNDLLMETYLLLNENEETRRKYQEQYTHILVDEFQDTNPAQMEILKLLVSGRNDRTSFWICGDDWQSIYAFTGASVSNILNFGKMFPGCNQFVLDLNYRSTPQILQVCQNLIRHNSRKIEKTLRTLNPEGEGVLVLEAANEEDEALQIVNEIRALHSVKGYAYKNIAVLYRANSYSRSIEEVFSKQRVPYHIEKGTNFYERPEVKTLLEYLRFINDPLSDEGDEAFKSIINVPNRYIGRKFIGDLEEYSAESARHLYAGLKSMKIEIPYLRRYTREFIEVMDPLIRDAKAIEPSEMIAILRDALDYDRFVTDLDLPAPDDEKIANINQLQLAANRYNDIKTLLNYAESFKEKLSNNKNGTALMTIHKAKGLEFPAVFLTGLMGGHLPATNGDLEEERRIAFVGISRAMKILYLTYCQTYGGRQTKRSTFLGEMLGKE